MKKLLLISSFLLAFAGAWTSCEPSKKGGGSPGTTDSLSTQSNSAPVDSTMRPDTSHQ